MVISGQFGLEGLAALGTVGSVLAVLLRSAHLNLKTLDSMRRDAAATAERLRLELREHDDTIFELHAMCADYRLAIAKLEAENDHLRRALPSYTSRFDPIPGESESLKSPLQDRPEDVLD